jgi:hypothetical protein
MKQLSLDEIQKGMDDLNKAAAADSPDRQIHYLSAIILTRIVGELQEVRKLLEEDKKVGR